ncbi:MAG: hypothetical protein JWM95_3268 [Gemmatimonadetes bacterium]|nr:hypothetical protein [Gemmatimonadota bacterium]
MLVRWGGVVLMTYFGYRSVTVLAGETTTADIGIKILSDLKVSEAAAWIFGAGGMTYGARQRSFRLKANQVLGSRVSELETDIDRRRSSSKLTTRGLTNPSDAL